MKGTYVFEQGANTKQTMILDELKVYVSRGPLFEVFTFADDKAAAQGFNQIMTARFSPRAGWRIVEKRMGEAVPPPPERMVGYVAPATTDTNAGSKANLSKSPIHIAGDHLMIAVETATDPDIAKAITAHRKTVRHLCFYARFNATAGLTALLKKPWPGLETLVIDAYDQTVTRQASCKVGDLSAVLPVVPDVRRVYVAGKLGFSKPLRHTALAHLSLLGNPLPARSLGVLASSSFPELARLDLALATEAEPDEGWLEELSALIRAARQLDVLTIDGPVDGADLLRALAPLGEKVPRELRLMTAWRDENDLVSAATALAEGGAAPALAVPAGELVEETLAALRKMFPRVDEVEPTAFLPSAYGSARFHGDSA